MANRGIRQKDINTIVRTTKRIAGNRKASNGSKALSLVVFFVLALGYFWYGGHFDSIIYQRNLPIPTSPGFVEPAQVHGPEGSYELTEWDSNVDKNYYRLAGSAVVEHDGIAPGDIVYFNLDVYGRATGAVGNLTSSNYVPGKEREDAGEGLPDPVGYHAYYSGDSDQYAQHVIGPDVALFNGDKYNGWSYNRSHLIADSLGGAPIVENLVTGTRMQNVGTNNVSNSGYGGMAYCEEIARNYLASHDDGETLYYCATPIYQGEELLPRSVFVDMLSSDGKIDMHVEVYNAMFGYEVNYADGTLSYVG